MRYSATRLRTHPPGAAFAIDFGTCSLVLGLAVPIDPRSSGTPATSATILRMPDGTGKSAGRRSGPSRPSHQPRDPRERARALITLRRFDEAEHALREAIAGDVPTVTDRILLAAIDLITWSARLCGSSLSRGRRHRRGPNVPSCGGSFLVLRGGPFRTERPLSQEAFRADPACAQWLLTTQSSLWARMRSNPQVRAVLERFSVTGRVRRLA